MKILHVVPGLEQTGNGIAVAAKLIAAGQRREGHEVDLVDAATFISSAMSPRLANEVWVHSMWTPPVWRSCLKVLGQSLRLVRMTHANLDPMRYRYHGWKKRLVAPIERWLFRRTDRVAVTGEWEADWCRSWGLKNAFQIIDLKSHFNFQPSTPNSQPSTPLHVLYLGRRHPLKGVRYLEQAVDAVNQRRSQSNNQTIKQSNNSQFLIDLRIVSDHYGEELERDWAWCDVLCLPTLSENFGLVVAEALERGKRVVTTDGAPAWEPPPPASAEVKVQGQQWRECLVYLRGYRTGTDTERVRLLRDALTANLGK